MYRVAFVTLLVVVVISFWRKDTLPPASAVQSELQNEPVQTPTTAPPFEMTSEGVQYTIKPLYDYELWGLVVSYHDPKETWLPSIHKYIWKDFINVKDLCVVWGTNLGDNLKKLKFSSGTWTCWVKAPDAPTWSRFAMNKLSNNHLLARDKSIQAAIAKAEVGDEIHLKGWLSEYKSSLGGQRGTSTTREDNGEGACETIFVSEFEILKRHNSFWKNAFDLSRIALVLLFGSWLYSIRLK